MTKHVNLCPGDVLITRNAREEDNNSPGYWNHASIYVGNGEVIEAQDVPYERVICSEWDEFYNRYPKIVILRHLKVGVGDKAAKHARKFLGVPYRAIASIFRRLRKISRGENCVSVVRKSMQKATGRKIVWRIPDHIIADRIFVKVYEKEGWRL